MPDPQAVRPAAPLRRSYWQSSALDAMWSATGLPGQVETVIVGAGATGISAARELAQRGHDVLLLDRGMTPGASLGNGGFVGDQLRQPFSRLAAARGLEAAVALYDEAHRAYDYVAEVVAAGEIDCAYTQSGRITLVETPEVRDSLVADLELKRRHLGQEYELLSPAALAAEISAPNHVAGIFLPGSASLDPARYLAGQLKQALRAGARFSAGTEVLGIGEAAGGYRIETDHGPIAARNVVIATNGADPRALAAPMRLAPLPGHMIALRLTDAPPFNHAERGRTYNEAKPVFAYFRVTPDGASMLFGGRTETVADDPAEVERMLLADLKHVLPGVRGEVTHVWSAQCSESPDLLPWICRDGALWMAGGYRLGGLSMATWYGHLLAAYLSGENPVSTFGPKPVN